MSAPRPIKTDIVFGTRPEAVKLLRLIQRLREDERFAPRVITTGQHREMAREILEPFGVTPDIDLGLMTPGQTLNQLTSRMLPKLDRLFEIEPPDVVVVQGDTTTAFSSALAAFHRGILVAHIEAGLRSFNRFHPYPEEVNRRMLSCLADVHFAPTASAADNLLREGIPREDVFVTGNTVVDALLAAMNQIDNEPKARSIGAGRMVLMTLHRREGWDPVDGTEAPLESILRGIRAAAEEFPTVEFVFPLHLNERVRGPARSILAPCNNVRLLETQPYVPFVRLMTHATVILTDSGGIQEEAPSLGVPVLVLRRTTERPESMPSRERLLGNSPDHIVEQLRTLLENPPPKPTKLPCVNPFGDGLASSRIQEGILHLMGFAERPQEFDQPRPMTPASVQDQVEKSAASPHISTPSVARGRRYPG